jgi:hypothetical protein
MKIVCAWCKSKLYEVEPFEDERTSHGMCIPCRDDALKELTGRDGDDVQMWKRNAAEVGDCSDHEGNDECVPHVELSALRKDLHLEGETCPRCGAAYEGFPLHCGTCGANLRCAGC